MRKANEKPDIKPSSNKESALTHSMILGGYKALAMNYTIRRSGAHCDISGKLKGTYLCYRKLVCQRLKLGL